MTRGPPKATSMNRIHAIANFHENAQSQAPDQVGPLLIFALVGAVSFIEAESTSLIGVVGGINLVVAGLAAAAGTSFIVLILVVVGSRAALANRRAGRVARSSTTREASPSAPAWSAPESPVHASSPHYAGPALPGWGPPSPSLCGGSTPTRSSWSGSSPHHTIGIGSSWNDTPCADSHLGGPHHDLPNARLRDGVSSPA
jgi:hypothetical protein